MKRRIAILACATLVAGACSSHRAEDASTEVARPTAMGSDFVLTNQSITLPADDSEVFPAGPGLDQVNSNCRACHSPSMILTQPPLTHEEWVKGIDKMRATFKAKIDEKDVPAILEYLDAHSKQAVYTTGAATR